MSAEQKQIVQISHIMRDAKFKPPEGDCLSPVGEYNLRLGIMKELHPDLVATFLGAPATASNLNTARLPGLPCLLAHACLPMLACHACLLAMLSRPLMPRV